MILVKEMPISGQFVAVWTNESGVWSDSYVWDNGCLLKYDDYEDCWRNSKAFNKVDTRATDVYFIKKESKDGI